MQHWLMKSEPDEFGIDDLAEREQQTEPWDGVRNYQARNMLRDQMRLGDRVFFYHSNTTEPGIVGICEIVREGYPDPTAFDPDNKHHDPRSDPANPRWFMVDVRLVRRLRRTITLRELKADSNPALEGLALLRAGNRLSVMPVAGDAWEYILGLEDALDPGSD